MSYLKEAFSHLEEIDESIIIENRSYARLTEANLNRVVKGHDASGYVMISASRSMANYPDGYNEQQVTDENNKRTARLRKAIYDNGFSHIKAYGGYKEDGDESGDRVFEKSFIVYPYSVRRGTNVEFDEFVDTMLKLGKDFNQDTILVKYPDGDAVYVDCSTGEEVATFNGVNFNDVTQDYFTSLKNWKDNGAIPGRNKGKAFDKGKPQRFTFESVYVVKGGNYMSRHSKFASDEMFFG